MHNVARKWRRCVSSGRGLAQSPDMQSRCGAIQQPSFALILLDSVIGGSTLTTKFIYAGRRYLGPSDSPLLCML
jgi:hypothetical protein